MWNRIDSQGDIDNLLAAYYGFHDSCICSVEYKSGAMVKEDGFMSGISEDCTNEYFNPENYETTELIAEPMETYVVANRLEWRFT